MDIEQGNKLIAEFLGWGRKNQRVNWAESRINYATWQDLEGVGHKTLFFHSSWDWLMPACKKWDKLNNIPDEIWEEFERRCKLLNAILSDTWDCREVFYQLAENIQWYNQDGK